MAGMFRRLRSVSGSWGVLISLPPHATHTDSGLAFSYVSRDKGCRSFSDGTDSSRGLGLRSIRSRISNLLERNTE